MESFSLGGRDSSAASRMLTAQASEGVLIKGFARKNVSRRSDWGQPTLMR